MNRNTAVAQVQELMQEFAGLTGLDRVGASPLRYLWTDAFAVCNYLGLFEKTGYVAGRELALRLVGQRTGRGRPAYCSVPGNQ